MDGPEPGVAHCFEVRGSVAAVMPWPKVGVWKQRAGKWREIFPTLMLYQRPDSSKSLRHVAVCSLSLAEQVLTSNRAFNRWLASVPQAVLREARRYGTQGYRVLRLFSLGGGAALELSQSAGEPLCLALANAESFRESRQPISASEAPSLVGKKRREIAGWLGFPAREAGAQILRKAHVLDLNTSPVEFLLALREVMENPAALKKLCHLPAVNESVVRVLSTEACAVVSTDFLRELLPLGRPEREQKVAQGMLGDALCMWSGIEPRPVLPALRRLEDAERFHDSILERHLEIARAKEVRGIVFPKPPLEGTEQIVPITTPKELLREGRECHHCVTAFADEVSRGKAYFYRVLAPERATAMIKWMWDPGDLSWGLLEIKAPCNKPVTRKTRRAVNRWLSRSQGASEYDREPPWARGGMGFFGRYDD